MTAKWTLTGIEEREQSNGKPMVVVESTAEYTNSDGELLATNVETVIWVKR